MEERAFATIAKDSVKMMAESVGISNLPDDVAAALGEDVNYRLREIVMKSTAYMKSAKRRRLCPDDFNQTLRDMNVQPVYGQSSLTECPSFRQTREGELHFVEESDVNLSNTVFNSYIPKHLGETSIKAQWMSLEGVNKFLPSHGAGHLQSKSIKKETPPEVLAYYNHITKALVGSRPMCVRWALTNLSANKRVQSAMAFFVNFVANGVKVVNHDVVKLTLLMKTVAALVKNKTVFLQMQPYLRLLVQSVETCLLEPLSHNGQQSPDHWALRRLAASVLAHIVRKWDSPVNRLRPLVVSKLADSVQDLGRPLCAHFGAVVGLMALGLAEVEAVLVPQLSRLLPHLQACARGPPPASPHTQAHAITVLEALQLSMESLLKTYLSSTDLQNSTGTSSRQPMSLSSEEASPASCAAGSQEILRLYRQLSDSLGDALSARLPVLELDRVFPRQPSSQLVSLGDDQDSQRSGEELLDRLMRLVRQEQQQHDAKKKPGLRSADTKHALFPDTDRKPELTESVPGSAALEAEPGFQERQLAVSSTISDPSKGTLKLKIKRHPHGSPSHQPRRVAQPGRGRGGDPLESPTLQQSKESREHRLKRKRKQQGRGRSPWEEAGDLSDPEEWCAPSLLGQAAQPFSPGEDSSSSESGLNKKGKLMLKLKVSSRDSPSE